MTTGRTVEYLREQIEMSLAYYHQLPTMAFEQKLVTVREHEELEAELAALEAGEADMDRATAQVPA